jgi:hypothetical protein
VEVLLGDLSVDDRERVGARLRRGEDVVGRVEKREQAVVRMTRKARRRRKHRREEIELHDLREADLEVRDVLHSDRLPRSVRDRRARLCVRRVTRRQRVEPRRGVGHEEHYLDGRLDLDAPVVDLDVDLVGDRPERQSSVATPWLPSTILSLNT